MTDTISISDFKNREDRTLLVGVDFDDTYWLHVYILDEEFHILTYSNVDDEIKIISEFISDESDANDLVTWSNFATTIDVELKALLDARGVRFTIEWENEHSLEADEDGFFAPVPDLD
jgi:hypothetical protein